jgi:flagellar assembly protein FliH
MAEIRPFEMRSFEEEARSREREEEARDIVAGALAERERIREEARRAGFEAGLAQGREAGAKAERERIAAESAGLADLLRNAASSVESRRAELAAEAERDLLRLAVAIAEKVLRREVVRGDPVAPATVRRAIELMARRHEVRILLHPADVAVVEAVLPDLRRRFPDLGTVSLEASPGVSLGGCRVVSREGAVDADFRTQLEEIERGLLG